MTDLIVEYCDFVSEELLMATTQPSVPAEKQIVYLPTDEEGQFRFVIRQEWRPSITGATQVTVYLSDPKG